MASARINLPRPLVLFGKLVLVIVPIFCLLAAVGLYFVYKEHYFKARDAFVTRIGNSAGRSVSALEQILTSDQHDEELKFVAAQQVLLMLLGDQSIECATLSRAADTSSQLVAPIGLGCAFSNSDEWLNIDLSATGWSNLRIGFSNAELTLMRNSKLRQSFIVLISSLAASLLSSWFAFRWIVGKPLNDLIKDLVEARDAAEYANAVKVRFLANMSHEVRTPMNGIIGTAELLHDSDLDDNQRQSVQTISKSANALMMIIEDILDFAKIEAAHLELHEQQFDLGELVDSVIKLIEPAARSKGLDLVLDYSDDHDSTFHGDEARLRQVLLNLLGNAVKFTSEGTITLSVQAISLENGSNVTFRVTDMGIGIPDDKLAKIFEPFSQVFDETNRQFEGTGLGLSISSELVTLMGGTISAKSTLGKGSEFEFMVQLRYGQKTVAPYEIKALKELAKSRTIKTLLIGKVDPNLKIISQRLSEWNITCEMLGQPDETIERMRRAARLGPAYDAVILGLDMTKSTSGDLATLIRKEPTISQTPLILLSSSTLPQCKHSTPHDLFDAILTKPTRSKTLAHTLNSVLKNRAHVVNEDAKDTSAQVENLFAGVDFLLVDDNEINLRVLTLQLTSIGARTRSAFTGSQAIEIIDQNPPDIILMDISMPVMNGFDAAKEIRKREKSNNRVPSLIFAVSGNVMREHQEAAEEAGMDGFIAKPTRREDLINSIAPKWIDACNHDLNTTLNTPPDIIHPNNLISERVQDRLINNTTLSNLRKMISENDFSDFAALLIENGDGALAEIANYIESGDWNVAAATAHKLSGSAASFGCIAIAQAMSALAQDLSVEEPVFHERMSEINSVWADTKTALTTYLK